MAAALRCIATSIAPPRAWSASAPLPAMPGGSSPGHTSSAPRGCARRCTDRFLRSSAPCGWRSVSDPRQRLAALPSRAGDDQGGLGARGSDPMGLHRGPTCRDRARRWLRARIARVGRGRERPPRTAVHAARSAVARRPDPGAGRQAHGLGLHPVPSRSIGPRSATARRAHGGTGRALRPWLQGRDPRPSRADTGGFQRRNANLVCGDVGGGSYVPDQLFLRPVPRLIPYRTPVRGLYVASAGTFPGGGVHGVPGRAAARLALSAWRIRPWTSPRGS
jgi:hypothetical protein